MAEEPGAGAVYLSALKQSASARPAAAASVHAPEAPPSAEIEPSAPAILARPTSMEKRRSPRHPCQGSVRLQESGSTVATWATITDINLHGCYVEAAASYRVGTQLDLKLEVKGLLVEATGEVRVAYPQLGMGVSFTRMSRKDRERLELLVSSIAPTSVGINSMVATPSPLVARSEPPSPTANPEATLQAIVRFFEDRHVMGREEFFKIMREKRLVES